MCCVQKILPGLKQRLSTVRIYYDLRQKKHVVLFLSIFYNLCTIFRKIIELLHSTIFYSQMNKQNQTIKQLNYETLPMYIYILFI